MSHESQLNLERKKLEEVKELFLKIMEESKITIDKLPELYKDDPIMLYNLSVLYGNKILSMEKNYSKPYFARIDFNEDGTENVQKCYLSKVGVVDDNNDIVTVDWRAPIASIYYDSSVGKTSYEAPGGIIEGDLLLKRQYDIENGEMSNYRDVDIVSNDDILAPYLTVNADNRLKNIVASIQSEQNAIIREKLNKNLVIQGVAGSGKTTVALHRIAYLVYTYMKDINPEQFLVIGPNKFFVNYISGVLPDLDVNNVSQLTYDELIKKYLKENFSLISTEEKLIQSISHPEDMKFEKFRTSMLYKETLDRFVEDYIGELFGKRNLEINDYVILNSKTIKNIYESVSRDPYYKGKQSKQLERVILLTTKYIEDYQNDIISNIWNQYREKSKSPNLNDQRAEMARFNKAREEVRKKCRSSVKKYFSKRNQKILPIYIEFLNSISRYVVIDDSNFEQSVNNTISNLREKKVEFEDLAAIMYLKYKICDTHTFDNIRHVSIDEAQDFGEFNFYALKKAMPNATFSIFGDLAQSIYQYRDLKDWDTIIESSFNGNCDLKYLLKSYRTTAEIMNSANNIIEQIDMKKAQPVIRHGASVKYIANDNDQIESIIECIAELKEKGHNSFAIITKTEEEAMSINKKLQKYGIKLENITSKNTKYVGGYCTVPCYLAKGLEFDSVFISDASEDIYHSDSIIDMKLLYVAMTRALHELSIFYSGEINKALTKEVIKEKVKQK